MSFANSGHTVQSLLRREHRASPAPIREPQEAPVESEYEAFSYCRVGIRPQLMVTFRKSNGTVKVRPYSLLQALDSEDGNSGFRLEFPDVSVLVQGRNLSKLFAFLALHRVADVVEADIATQFAEAERNCVVESLEFEFRI